jgi:hypothetical protein
MNICPFRIELRVKSHQTSILGRPQQQRLTEIIRATHNSVNTNASPKQPTSFVAILPGN